MRRLLIGSRDASQLIHWEGFGRALAKFGVECRVVNNIDVVDGFPTKKIHRWRRRHDTKKFGALVRDFGPDVIMTDGLRHFGLAAARSGIPVILHLAGDYWTETKCAKATRYGSFPRSLAMRRLEEMAAEIMAAAKIIMPVSGYLDGIVRARLPGKPTHVLRRAMDPSVWRAEKNAEPKLRHPCIGMVQKATIWNKAREMLVLADVLGRLPDVTFYWAGGGPYAKRISRGLERYPNFRRLGALDYPDGVRRFLSEVDVYALITGLEAASVSLREALLMGRPALATNVGGIPEIVEDGKTGMLVEPGDPDGIVDGVSSLLGDPAAAVRMGGRGRKAAVEDTAGDDIARGFVEFVESELGAA